MRWLVLLLFVAVAVPVRAQDAPPMLIQAEGGVATFGWANDVQADLVIVILNRGDCEIVGHYAVDPNEVQQVIHVPPPGSADACRLRLADQITLLRYRNTGYIDKIGPYTQRGRVLIPMVQG